MQKSSSSDRLINWSILILLSLVWGSSYILIKKGLVAFNPVQLACLRVSLSGLAFFPIYFMYQSKVDWRNWKFFLVVGLGGTFIPAFLYALAQTELNSSITGVLGALTPLNTILIAVLFFNVNAKRNEWFGVILGLIGAVVLILFGSSIEWQNSLFYGALVFIATACYGLSSNTVKAKLQDVNPLALSSAAFVMIVPPAIALLPIIGVQDVLVNDPLGWSSLGYITLLSLLGTAMASILFFYLVQRTNPIFASTVSYLIPMVALAWGHVDQEVIGWGHLVGMIIILYGVYLTRQK